ncbi:hypothetical protein ACFL2K_01005 [Candidatus Margulisiibacteriota bacterium]
MVENIWIIGAILKLFAGLFTFLAALFGFLAVLQNKKHEKTKIWFRQKWERISVNPWLSLPEIIIHSIIEHKNNLLNFSIKYQNSAFFKGSTIFLVIIFHISMFSSCEWPVLFCFTLLSFFFIWKYFMRLEAKLAMFLLEIFLITLLNLKTLLTFEIIPLIFSILLSIIIFIPSSLKRHLVGSLYALMMLRLYLLCMFGCIPLFWVVLSLKVELVFSWFLILISLICLLVCLPAVCDFRDEQHILTESNRNYVLFSFSIWISFTITMLAFLFGNLAYPLAYIPKTLQMLTSNVVFDSITILFTFLILNWALRKKGLFRIPFAIIIDCIVAALLACFSLYFGLVLTKYQLSFDQVLFILIGKDLSGKTIQFGPYFWTMHTTFLPTLVYLFIIIVAWLAKIMLMPVKWFFGKGQEQENPLALTAALCTLLIAVFGVPGMAIVDYIEKYSKEKKVITEKTTVEVNNASINHK